MNTAVEQDQCGHLCKILETHLNTRNMIILRFDKLTKWKHKAKERSFNVNGASSADQVNYIYVKLLRLLQSAVTVRQLPPIGSDRTVII